MTTGVLRDSLDNVCGGLSVAMSVLSEMGDRLSVVNADDLFFLLRGCREKLEFLQDDLPGENVEIGSSK